MFYTWKKWCLAGIAAASLALPATAQERLQADTIFTYMKKVNDWQFKNLERKGWTWQKWDWTNGALYAGAYAYAEIANDPANFERLLRISEDNGWNTGPRRLFADDYCVGQLYSQLYRVYGEEPMIRRWRSLADSIGKLPHDEPLDWKNGIHMREWAWCDALFMGPPALAYLSTATNDPSYLETAVKLWWKTSDFLYNKSERLYYRDARYFDKKESNGANVFWSRGNGWVMGGLVRMLANMPANHPSRPAFEKQFKEMATRLAGLQYADGTWHAALLDMDSYPSKETSGTGFFIYAMAWGVNNGLLPKKDFRPVLVKGWNALQQSVHADGKLGFVQKIADSPGKTTFDDTEVYGVGAFLLAGTELLKMALAEQQFPVTVEVYNPAGAVAPLSELDYAAVAAKWKPLRKGPYKIINTVTGKEVAYQLITEGGKQPVKILVDAPLAPGGRAVLTFAEGVPAPVEPKTYGRYIAERLDDYAWENDRVAFRMYGRALESQPKHNAYGVDFWNKRTEKMIVNSWYKRTNYHKDEGEGLDGYSVGFTLGAGGIAPYTKDSIWYSRNYTGHRMLDSGALRTTFELQYEPWNADGKQVSVVKRVSIDAHSQLSRMEITYTAPLTAAVGIVKRNAPGTEYFGEQDGVMGYWEPASPKDGTTGIGVVMVTPVKEMAMEKGHLLSIVPTAEGNKVVYYTGGAWDKAGLITNSGEWFNYLRQEAQKLRKPVQVRIY
ncbi:glycoside hydrolase family 88 protein [Chitinophaga sp. NPDC101104]|uniref:glycoside hydrolase family 88 protein n=1 Tax=Chitinophaga sp. NPDC101104 TaxID=3390561 RepID=UPI003D04991C